MTADFKTIIFTSPISLKDEQLLITMLLESGVIDFIHLRKPGMEIHRMRNLIKRIPNEFHERIKIHDNFQLLDEFNLHGPHLNSRNPVSSNINFPVSKSCHSIKELSDSGDFEYVTLSPIYDSISKNSYHTPFILSDLKKHIKNKNVIALGGVTPDKFPELKEYGFYGAALLGYFWEEISIYNIKYRIDEIRKFKSMVLEN